MENPVSPSLDLILSKGRVQVVVVGGSYRFGCVVHGGSGSLPVRHPDDPVPGGSLVYEGYPAPIRRPRSELQRAPVLKGCGGDPAGIHLHEPPGAVGDPGGHDGEGIPSGGEFGGQKAVGGLEFRFCIRLNGSGELIQGDEDFPVR